MTCPGCGESDARKVSVLFEQGTTVNKMNPMAVVGMGGENPGIVGVVAGVKWKGQSALASRLSPPSLSKEGKYTGITVCVALFFVGTAIGGAVGPSIILAGVAAGILTCRSIQKRELPGVQAALTTWNRQWCCMRCGEVFEGGEP
jgi:hypothetical protein